QIQSLDEAKGGLRNNFNPFRAIFDFLTRYDDKGLPAPSLAQSWETSPDRLTWTFKLRPNVKFHNGRELTADDVKFSVERILNPETGSQFKGIMDPVKQVDVVDKMTVKSTTNQPSVVFPAW